MTKPDYYLYVWYDHPFYYGKRLFDIYHPPLRNISPNYFGKCMKLSGVIFEYKTRP